QVEVAEVGVVARIEIRIADIAPADDRHVAIGDERLVMHAAVEPVRVEQELGGLGQHRRLLGGERIEQAHFDVRVGIQRIEQVDRIACIDVVHQQAHAHAAVRRGQQPLRHQPPGRVVVEDVVLQVQRMLRVVGQRHAAHQRIGAAHEQAEAGFVLVPVRFGMHVARGGRADGGRQCLRRLLEHGRRRRTGRQCHSEQRRSADLDEVPHTHLPFMPPVRPGLAALPAYSVKRAVNSARLPGTALTQIPPVTTVTRNSVSFAAAHRSPFPTAACMTGKNTGPDTLAFLPEGSELAGLIRAFDWQGTAMGELRQWPEYLRTVVALMLRSAVPMTLQWGREGWMIYNDAYRGIAAARHPALLGKTIGNAWAEIADFRQGVVDRVLDGNTLSYRNEHFSLMRIDGPEDVWLDIDYSPVVDVAGIPVGVLAIVKDTSARFRAEQRLLIAQEAGDVGTFELYPQSGRFEVSSAFRRIWGLDDEVSVTAELMNSLVHPDDRQTSVAREMELADQL